MSILIGLSSLLVAERCIRCSDTAWNRGDKGEAWAWLCVGVVALALMTVLLVVS